jgi:sec-independent protein translocase protein TatC
MARALKRPKFNLKPKLPASVSSRMPRLPDPNEPDIFEEMTLLEHMEELRDRIVKTAIAIGVAFIAGFFFARPLLERIGLQSGVLDRGSNGELLAIDQFGNPTGGFDIGGPTDTITIFMKVALYIALSIAAPIILYQMFGFLAPGLTRKEKRILLTSLPFVALLFVAGALYAFFQAAPRALAFLESFGRGIFNWDIDGNETISFYLTLMVGLGLAFQLPVVMFLLAKLNILGPKKMGQYRKYALLVIIVLSAVITPTTDPISLALVAVPLYILYELGIIISYLFARPSKPATPTAAA